MKKYFVIQDLVSKEYFQGVNPKPCFDVEIEYSRKFDFEEEALDRLQEEIDLWEKEFFEGRIFSIITIYTL
jgi:hypothetical protein